MSTDDSPESTDQPGEFTRLFRPVLKPSPPAGKLPPDKDAVPKDPAPPPPGEFTQMFKAVSPKTPASSSTPTEPAALPEPTRPRNVDKQPQRPERASKFRTPETKPEPGEFTRMFRPPVESQAEAQPPAKTASPGDFTRMFSVTPAAPPAPPTPGPASAPEPPKASKEPGSFTAFFKQPSAKPVSPTPAAPPPAPGQESEFTRFFKDPLPPVGREVNWKAIENQPASLPAAKAPGEFTRMFGRAERGGPAPTAEEGSKAAPGVKSSTGQVDDFANMFAQSAAAREPQATAAAPVQASPPSAKTVSPAVTKPGGPPVFVLVILIAAVLVLAGCALYYFVFRK